MSASIRAFHPADRDSLCRAIDSVCGEGRWMSTPRFQPTRAWYHALAVHTCPEHLLLVAEEGGRVIGWCRLFLQDAGSGRPGCFELGIGLLEGHRGQGLGKAFLRQALDWAAVRQARKVALTVRTDNVRAAGLFQGCGFRDTGPVVDGWVEMECRPRRAGG